MLETLRVPERQDKEPPLDLKFYVTDHSPDTFDTGNTRALQDLYNDIKKDGVSSVRYDWRWKNIEPDRSQFDEESLRRYAEAPRLMNEAGLEPPTIVVSSIPKWAEELYKKDKNALALSTGEFRTFFKKLMTDKDVSFVSDRNGTTPFWRSAPDSPQPAKSPAPESLSHSAPELSSRGLGNK